MLIDFWTNRGHAGVVREISKKLKRTRNSIIGRARRLKLPFIKQPQQRRKRVQVRITGPKLAPPPVLKQWTSKQTELPPRELWTWAAARTSILDLKSDQCHWPVGDREFCGGECEPDKPYCPVHTRIAFIRRKEPV